MLSCEELAIMRNLPALVSDLDSMDIIDHLTATTPPLITPTDYESIISTSQREGRRAGVRCLIACLLRRSEIQKVFRCFLNILKEDYGHLFDLLDKTYESLKNKTNDESDFGALSKISFCSSIALETENPLTVTTPCQSVSKDVDHSKMFLKGLGVSENDIIFNIISTICSHPIAVMNWKNLLNELIGCNTINPIGIFMNSNNSHLKNSDSSMKDFEDFLWCASNCRRGLFHFFSINIIRNLENRGSPLKRSYPANFDTVKFNAQLIRKLVTEKLIPTLQHFNLWNLANRIQTQIEYNDANNCDSVKNSILDRCSLLYMNSFPLKLLDSTCHNNINNDSNLLFDLNQPISSYDLLKSCPQFNYAKSLLFSCIEPIFHHSLILLDWPFLLHELNVCSNCILYLLSCHSSSQCLLSTKNNSSSNSSILLTESNNCNSFCQNIQDEKIKNVALVIPFCTILQNTLYQKMIIDQDSQNLSQPVQSLSESVQKSCVASIIHTKLLPALQCLDLNALHGEIEQLAFQMLH
ncbi:uncharacterized protein DC041_0003747 [Schistosoma bovis]|uniref:Caspase recruitment domain-containing protein n=1 Tax=Schistosoma bovis TaxID=6184 RepID=A0A430QM64_SCHBO|nr:uncharacterized protein DC041_0003747 [Schistosoma bovis]